VRVNGVLVPARKVGGCGKVEKRAGGKEGMRGRGGRRKGDWEDGVERGLAPRRELMFSLGYPMELSLLIALYEINYSNISSWRKTHFDR
jgi:hypothetical protein